MVYNAKGCLMPNTELPWKNLFYNFEIEKYKLIQLTLKRCCVLTISDKLLNQ